MLKALVKEVPKLNSEDTLGRVLSKLQEYQALPVFNKEYLGMLYLRDLIMRDFDTGAKIESLVRTPRRLSSNLTEVEFIDAFLEYPLLPFFEEKRFLGLLSAVDFLKFMVPEGKACEFSSETEIINEEADLGVARNKLQSNEVLLVEKKGEIVGGIDVFSMSKQIIPKFGIDVFSYGRSPTTKIFGTSTAEKITEKEIKIRPVETEAISANSDKEIKEAVKLLEEHTFLVCGREIITSKTILRKMKELRKDKKIPNLELAGFDLQEGIYTDIVYKELVKFAKKTNSLIKPIEIKFHLRKLKETGKTLYGLDGKVLAGGNAITANVTGYGIMDLVQEVIEKLNKQISKVVKK